MKSTPTLWPSRRLAAIIAAALALMVAATFGAHAAGPRYEKGEGGRGLDAFLGLGLDDQVRLGLISCEFGPKTANLQLGLFRGAAKTPDPELVRLWNGKDGATLDMQVCTAGSCRDTRWEYLESSYGDAFFARAALAPGPKAPLDSIRIAIPDAHGDYVWRGDLGAVLRRICH